MSFITDWAGNVIQSPDPHAIWSQRGGVFTPATGQPTYFPLPSAYRNAISCTGSYIIPANQQNRPDLIAHTIYGSEDYWWLVFWYNGIVDPFAYLVAGKVLLVADLSSVNSLLG